MNTFSIQESVKSSWRIFKNHWKFVVLATLATAFIEIILNFVGNGAEHSGAIIGLIAKVFIAIIGIIITLGWSRVTLSLLRTDFADWDTFKTDAKTWLQYVKVMVWYFLYLIMWGIIAAALFIIVAIVGLLTHVQMMTLIGGILAVAAFALVSIYFAVRYQFINFIVLDKTGTKSRAMFKEAGEITRGHLWKLFGFAIVLAIINLIGAICLVVGLLVTIPVTKLARTKMYEHLKNKQGSIKPSEKL